jgi:hypothetical protein
MGNLALQNQRQENRSMDDFKRKVTVVTQPEDAGSR